MRKTRNSLGFTMAEMLIVVAIIAVLGGVAFIAVQNHQRSMAQLERNTIAKELFIAAQNHLTMAESEGYPVGAASTNFFGQDATDATVSNESTDETTTPSGDGGTEAEAEEKPTNVYYVIGPSSGNILDLMLPFGSIDETVRAGGSYLIRYQTNPALVLDVFYVTTSGNPARFNKDGGIKDDDYGDLMGKRDSLPSSGYVLGYYGGEIALSNGDIILPPTVEIHNEERLTVTVTDYNNGNVDAALKLIISGEKSGAKLAITLAAPSAVVPASIANNTRFYGTDGAYTIILDDVTNAAVESEHDGKIKDGMHFADLNAFKESEEGVLQFWQNEKEETPTFLPGENITVQAVAYSNTALTNIAYSSARTTNSLFADPGETSTTAMIANFRHLENLDANISKLDKSIGYTGAEQIADMVWKDEEDSTLDFVQVIKTDKSIEKVNIFKIDDSTGGDDNCFLPVTPCVWVKGTGTTVDSVEPNKLSYEGNGHTISRVVINGSGEVGLFGTLISDSSVANLKLVDFNVETSEGNAGALVGKLAQKTALDANKFNVSNVVAYNTGNGTDVTIKTGSGNAGGLIGQIVGDEAENATDKTAKAIIQKSAAALIVNATGGNAGGLVGSVGTDASCKVSDCYSGGHTIDDLKDTGAVVYDSSNYNVTAIATTSKDSTIGGYAGGLIGDAGNTAITNSYSTCSVSGMKAGGLVGKSSGNITNSYCTGLVGVTLDDDDKPVTGTSKGAFAAECTGTTTGCNYFEIINELPVAALGYDYLTPLPIVGTGDGSKTGISALDADASTYNSFTEVWSSAEPYLKSTLKKYYGEGTGDARVAKYNLKGMKRLNSAVTDADFVATHYGDWPAPEIFVVNTKKTGS